MALTLQLLRNHPDMLTNKQWNIVNPSQIDLKTFTWAATRKQNNSQQRKVRQER